MQGLGPLNGGQPRERARVFGGGGVFLQKQNSRYSTSPPRSDVVWRAAGIFKEGKPSKGGELGLDSLLSRKTNGGEKSDILEKKGVKRGPVKKGEKDRAKGHTEPNARVLCFLGCLTTSWWTVVRRGRNSRKACRHTQSQNLRAGELSSKSTPPFKGSFGNPAGKRKKLVQP